MRPQFEMHVTARYARLLWQLARPRTLVVVWLHGLLAYELLSGTVPPIWKIVGAFVVVAAWYVHAVALNDLSDEAVDKLNLVPLDEAKDRPLVNGTASSRQTRLVAYVAGAVMVAVCTLLALWLGGVALLALGLNAVYSLPPARVSARGGLAQLLLPLGYVGLPASVAIALAGTWTSSFFVAVGGLYLLFMGRLFLKDIRDETGDRETGKRTFLVRHGLVPTLVQSGIWCAAGIALTLSVAGGSLQVLFMGIAALGIVVLVLNLRRCLTEPRLEYKLLRVAVVGRVASGWLFCLVLAMTLRYYAAATPLQVGVIIAAVVMFGFGIVSLHEERSVVRRRLEETA